MPKKEVRRNDRYVHFAWAAAVEAMARRRPGEPDRGRGARLADRRDHRLGHRRHQHHDPRRHRGARAGVERIGPFLVTALIPDMAAGYVAIYANARGPNYATVSACSSANHAIGDSANIIRRGDADVMIAGGAEAGIGEIPCAAFSAMRALSTKRNDDPARASRPFDAERDGFVLAKAPASWCSRSSSTRRARGATIHAEVVGYGATADASHITLPAPGGRGAVESMRAAIADAGLDARRHRLHQRPRHAHAAERPVRDGRHQDALRRATPTRSRSAARSR